MAVKSTEKVLKRLRKAPDLDTHVRVITVDGLRVVELRDYIPSLDEYGRGYWFPSDPQVINEVVQALLAAASEEAK